MKLLGVPVLFVVVMSVAACSKSADDSTAASQASSPPSEADRARAIELVQEARRNVEAFDYEHARRNFEEAARLDPNNDLATAGTRLAVVSVADAHQARKAFAQAERRHAAEGTLAVHPLLERATALDPNHVVATLVRARGAHIMRRFREVRSECDRIIRCFPDYAPAFMTAAEAAFSQGDWPACLEYTEAMRPLVDRSKELASNPRYWFLLGIAMRRCRDVRSPLDAFETLVQLRPKSLYYRRLLAGLHLDAARLEAAERELTRIVEMAPKQSRSHMQQAECLQRLGRMEEAAASYERAWELESPHRASTAIACAKAHAKLGEAGVAKAVVFVEKALALGQSSVAVLEPAARILRQAGRSEDASRCLTTAEASKERRLQEDEVIFELGNHLAREPNDTSVRLRLVDAYLARRDMQAAMIHTRKLLLHDADHVEGLCRMAFLLLTKSDFTAACWEARKVEAVAPSDVRGPNYRAAACHQAGKFEEAVAAGERVLALAPRHSQAVARLIEDYRRLAPKYDSRLMNLLATHGEPRKAVSTFDH